MSSAIFFTAHVNLS